MKKIYRITFIYMVIAVVSIVIYKNIINIKQGSPDEIKAILISLILQSLIAVIVYKKYREKEEYTYHRYKIFLFTFIPLVVLSAFTVYKKFEFSSAFFIPVCIAFMAGLNEELFFRGAIFTIAKKEKGLFKAIFISALTFSIMHIVNIFSGVGFTHLILQLINAFFAGLFLASIYHYTKSISLLVIYHWLWDYIPLSKITDMYSNIIIIQFIFMIVEFVVTIIFLKKYKRELNEVKDKL